MPDGQRRRPDLDHQDPDRREVAGRLARSRRPTCCSRTRSRCPPSARSTRRPARRCMTTSRRSTAPTPATVVVDAQGASTRRSTSSALAPHAHRPEGRHRGVLPALRRRLRRGRRGRRQDARRQDRGRPGRRGLRRRARRPTRCLSSTYTADMEADADEGRHRAAGQEPLPGADASGAADPAAYGDAAASPSCTDLNTTLAGRRDRQDRRGLSPPRHQPQPDRQRRLQVRQRTPPGQSVELARNDGYYLFTPGPAKVLIPVIKDAAAASQALPVGQHRLADRGHLVRRAGLAQGRPEHQALRVPGPRLLLHRLQRPPGPRLLRRHRPPGAQHVHRPDRRP